MEQARRKFPNSPFNKRFESFDDFVFLPNDGDLDFEAEPVPAKSPAKIAVDNVLVQAVISALLNVASTENLLVTNIAKTVLTGAATTITASVGGIPGIAVGALIAGGIYAYNNIRKKSATEVIKSMSIQQQKQLIFKVAKGLNRIGIRDLACDIINKREARDIALTILSNFLSENFHLRLIRC